MNDHNQSRISAVQPGLDALIEDVFGLNLRGLKTLGQLFTGPKKVFDSARLTDWQSRYTPTLRLTFSIITLFMLLSFFWAAEDSAIYQTILAQLTEAAARNPDLPPPAEILDSYFAVYSFFYPFAYMVIHMAVASLVWMWGAGTGWVTRLRLYFGLLAVGMTFALLSMTLMPFMEAEKFGIFTLISMSVGYLAYGLTYMRGMAGMFSRIRLLIRAAAISLIISIGDILVAFGAGIGAGFWIRIFGP